MEIQEFDFSVDLLRAILWQYDSAPNLKGLLEDKQAWFDANHTQFWDDWYRDVFDLRTANDFGLSVWAIILEIPLYVESTPDGPDKPIWGFGQYRKNFERGNFTSSNGSIGLTTEQKRLVLRLRYFQLTSRGAIPEINRFMAELFAAETGAAYALDGLDMSMVYVFTFAPSAQLRFILDSYDLLPRPAGVGVSYTILSAPAFGFGPYHLNFERGNFDPEA